MGTSQDDPFYSAKRRLSRAKTHMADFDTATKSFLVNEDVGEVLFEPDETDETKCLHKFRFKEPFPELVDDLAADAASNLRAALDNATFACAVLLGNPDPKSAKFPFGDTASDVENDIRRGCKDIPEFHPILRGVKPYKGANDALWSLNKLCNSQKHRLLVPVAITFHEDGIGFTTKGEGMLFAPEWDCKKNEVTFGESPTGENLDYNVKLTFFVVFKEIDVLSSIAAFDALDSMADEVEGVIGALEAECRRIGLIK